MFRRLLLLLALLPFVEIALLVWIAHLTSATVAIALVLVPTAIGLALTRYQGAWALPQVQTRIQQGEPPAGAVLNALLIWIAGVLLILPGVLTDVLGLLLLVPPIRRLVREYIQRRIRARLHVVSPPFEGRDQGDGASDHDRIIDVRVIDAEHCEPQEE